MDSSFFIWWFVVLGLLVFACWRSEAQREAMSWDHVVSTFILGLGAALALYVFPHGLNSIGSLQDFQLRFLGALGIAWLAGEWMTRRAEVGQGGYSATAFAGFVAVNVPPAALTASMTMLGSGPFS